MNRKQVYGVLKLLDAAYPQFFVDQSKVDIWAKILHNQNPAVVMRNAERYILTHKYPPSIADLCETHSPAFSNRFLQIRKLWERDAVGNDPRS